MKEQGLDLKGADLPRENVFIRELNGVTPQPYNLEGRALSIYVYPTIEASVKGMKEFGEKTEAAELEPYKMFTNNNLLVFYVDGSEEMNRTLQETINGLDTSQGNQELEADDVTNFVEFKGEVKKVEREGNLQGILVSPHVENETIDYEEAWFFTDNNLSYEPGQVVLVSYDTTQVHTSQFPPHYGAEKISIVKD
ncbi:hypothetical protein [Salimicrobium halophilum]|uniref:Uncharacterized protein n=1 Tax=Salimicrobium halophilum TaxID=86666 RepID=A0A1G8R7Z7_9BACI|nr:hypothetical protein [Salimicrobium halophilum]SDJ13154.1 hypothetical protein SAMN04490247_0886 [Salimicrobium halophilum]